MEGSNCSWFPRTLRAFVTVSDYIPSLPPQLFPFGPWKNEHVRDFLIKVVNDMAWCSNSLVIVCRKEAEIIWQCENFLVHRAIQSFRIAFLEICSSTPANQEGITGKSDALLVNNVSHAAVRVTGCWHSLELMPTEFHEFTVLKPSIRISTSMLANDTKRSRQQQLEISSASNMISMAMSVNGELEMETQLFDQRCVALSFFQNWKWEERKFKCSLEWRDLIV